MQKITKLFPVLCMLFLLTACINTDALPDEGLTGWALHRAGDAVNEFSEEFGEDILQALDDLKNAEYQGGPFENNLDSARAYLLAQMQEKYGMEFVVVDRENLHNYGPIYGASYSCRVAPAEAPEQITTALVSQTLYKDVRDGYAVYFFKEEAEAPVQALCESKDYVLDQRISLELPATPKTWTAEDELAQFLSQSGAYVQVVLCFADDLSAETYAEYLHDFLNSISTLHCNLLLQAKANGTYIFHKELNILEGFDPAPYTLESLTDTIQTMQKTGSPQ